MRGAGKASETQRWTKEAWVGSRAGEVLVAAANRECAFRLHAGTRAFRQAVLMAL